MRPPAPTVVVVGGGFSGAATAAHLLRGIAHVGTPLRVVVMERCGALGEGVAYGTREATHLLNVRAGSMSAWPDRPDDFVRWATQRRGPVKPTDFLPRQWYGEYVRESLLTAAAGARPAAELSVVFDEVRRVARHPAGGWLVHLGRGDSMRADAVVLAIGHRAPSDPIGRRWNGPRPRFIADPWRPFAMNAVTPDEAVIVLGTGLTAVDAVLSLTHEPRRAPITLVSRTGLLPQAHAAQPLAPIDLKPIVAKLLAAPDKLRASKLLHALRRVGRTSPEADWRSVVDGLRPHTVAVWQALPISERRRFLARLRPYWEAHRHRMALAVAERFRALRESDAVRISAGVVLSVLAEETGIRVVIRERGTKRALELDAAYVINCTGPGPSNSAAANPAIGSLLVDGLVRPDELGLGIETTAEGNAIDGHGQPVPDLYVVGTLRKPALWESTAVPELRSQAAAVAENLLARIRSR